MQPQLQRYVDRIRDIVARDLSCDDRAVELQGAVQALADDPPSIGADCRCMPESGHGRNLLYKDPDTGFVVVAMIWPAGYGSCVHDHAGTWCCMAVLEGRIHVQNYERIDDQSNPDFVVLHETTAFDAEVGAVEVVQACPHDYHTVANALDDGVTVTIHTYGTDQAPVRLIDLETHGVQICEQTYHNELASQS